MSKTILVDFKGTDNVSPTAKKVENSVSNLGKQSKKTANTMDASWKSVSGRLESLGNRFRFLTIAFSVIAAGSVLLAKSFVTAAREIEEAQLKLGVFAASAGEDFKEVNDAAQKLFATGLIPLNEASAALANLLATGIGLDRAEKLLSRFLDTAAVAKESLTDTLGKAVEKASLGFRIFQERQVDAVGINFKMEESIKKTSKELFGQSTNLTNAQRHLALYNFLMAESERFVGSAELATHTFSGTMSKLNASMTMVRATLGATLIPLVATFAEGMSSLSNDIRSFAEKFPALTSAIIVGTTALAVFTASMAALGAIIPLVVTGFKALSGAALFTLSRAASILVVKFTAVALLLGTITFLVLKATGQWDKWRNSMVGLTARISEIISPMKNMSDTMSEANEKLAKQIKTLEKNITLATRGFQEGMRDWVESHDKTVKQLTSQISTLERDYKSATQNIRDDFKSMTEDLSLSHARKTEDIQRQLDEEVSKGIWADQTRVRELQRSLKRENEDFAIASKKNDTRRKDDLSKEKTKFDSRLSELQTKLDEELVLEKKHATLIAQARAWPLLDEIEKRSRAFQEKIQQYNDELTELQNTNAAMIASNDEFILSNEKVAKSIDAPISKLARLKQEAIAAKQQADLLTTAGGRMGATLKDIFETVNKGLQDLNQRAVRTEGTFGRTIDFLHEKLKSLSVATYSGLNNFSSGFVGPTKLPQFKQGGIVPGNPNTPVPIMAHGGETVLPAGIQPVTININNPSVRSDEDITRIANAVNTILTNQQKFRQVK